MIELVLVREDMSAFLTSWEHLRVMVDIGIAQMAAALAKDKAAAVLSTTTASSFVRSVSTARDTENVVINNSRVCLAAIMTASSDCNAAPLGDSQYGRA
jgi:hypothetical protein